MELFKPAGRENYFKVNQELQLFCPGKNNKLTNNTGKKNTLLPLPILIFFKFTRKSQFNGNQLQTKF